MKLTEQTPSRGTPEGTSRGTSKGTSGVTRLGSVALASLLVKGAGTDPSGTATSLLVFRAPQALLIDLPVFGEVEVSKALVVIVVAAVCAVVFSCLAAMAVAKRRALKARTVRKVVLPSTKFDPSLEEVERVAAVLGRAHRLTRMPGTRSAHAVRIRLRANEGLVQWQLEGHRRSRSVLDLISYDQTESVPLLDPVLVPADDAKSDGAGGAVNGGGVR